MKIHSNVLTFSHLTSAVSVIPGVSIDRCEVKGSRVRNGGFDVTLESDGTPDQHGKPRRRTRNVGTAYRRAYGHPGFAASYDDWGHWLATLFEIDPAAIAGPYKGRDDFHAQTKDAYRIKETSA